MEKTTIENAENGIAIVSGMDADGNFGFYLKDDARVPSLKNTWGLTGAEHIALMDGQGDGRQIKWLEKNGYKPTLEEPDPPTPEQMAAAKRSERDRKLAETDKYMRPDFPITEDERQLVIEYSKWLRNLPTLEEFPNVEIPTVEEYLAAHKKD